MTTFWECVTIVTQTHCGWHEPVLPGGTEIAKAAYARPTGALGIGLGVAMAVGGVLAL